MRRLFASLVVVAAALLMVPSLGAQAQSEDDAAMAKQFVGMWRLVAYPRRFADGTTLPSPLSEGFIIYTETNRMCAVLMDPHRPKWNTASPYWWTPTESEARSAISGFDGYCSTVETQAKEGFVLHRARFPQIPTLSEYPASDISHLKYTRVEVDGRALDRRRTSELRTDGGRRPSGRVDCPPASSR